MIYVKMQAICGSSTDPFQVQNVDQTRYGVVNLFPPRQEAFPMDEGTRPIIANVERLHRMMDAERLSAVVARGGVNFTYLSGVAYPGTMARHVDLSDSPRPVFVVWPRHGDPVIVTNTRAEAVTRHETWVRQLKVYDPSAERPVQAVCDALQDSGLAEERVGFELGCISVLAHREIAAALPRMSVVDCGPMMDVVRSVKTPGEIALLKRAADVLDEALLEVFPRIREGDSERHVHGAIVAACMKRGAGWAHGYLNSSRNPLPGSEAADVPFMRGDLVRNDYVAYLQGYPGHQSRNAVLGEPSAEQRTQYAKLRDIYLATLDRCRPGARAGEVYAFVVERYAAIGIDYTSFIAGHSVGCWWHQQEPLIRARNPMVLEEGMVLALEPYPGGPWMTQDMIVVAKDGPQLLSTRFPTGELYRIPQG
jgi:Xaa-Pro aminopeptidase